MYKCREKSGRIWLPPGQQAWREEEACFVYFCIWIYFHKHVLVFVRCDNVVFLKDGTKVKTSKLCCYCSVNGFCLQKSSLGWAIPELHLARTPQTTDEPNQPPSLGACAQRGNEAARVPRGKRGVRTPSWPCAAVWSDIWRGNWHLPRRFAAVLDRNTTFWPPFQWTLNFLIIHTPLF